MIERWRQSLRVLLEAVPQQLGLRLLSSSLPSVPLTSSSSVETFFPLLVVFLLLGETRCFWAALYSADPVSLVVVVPSSGLMIPG
jgi:hypothetical protein